MTQWTVAYQAPLSMGFSQQEYWSRLPFPSPGDHFHLQGIFPIQGSNPGLPHCMQMLICISEVIDISPCNVDSSLCLIQPSVSHDVLCIQLQEYTVYSKGQKIIYYHHLQLLCKEKQFLIFLSLCDKKQTLTKTSLVRKQARLFYYTMHAFLT